MVHYHGLAGLHGYLPIYCETCETYNDAVDSLAFVHELGRDRTRELRRNGYLELSLNRDGNEYAEVSECDESDCLDGEYVERTEAGDAGS